MTIVFPKANWMDRILARFGKRRAVWIPRLHGKIAIHAYSRAIRESLWQALLRRPGQQLKDGWFYVDDILPVKEVEARKR